MHKSSLMVDLTDCDEIIESTKLWLQKCRMDVGKCTDEVNVKNTQKPLWNCIPFQRFSVTETIKHCNPCRETVSFSLLVCIYLSSSVYISISFPVCVCFLYVHMFIYKKKEERKKIGGKKIISLTLCISLLLSHGQIRLNGEK